MTSYKAGLHKKVFSIFDGVPVQGRSADSAVQQTSLPGFVTESSGTSEPTQTAGQPPRPVQKLYKDTAEKTHKLPSRVNLQKKTRFADIIQTFRAKLLPKPRVSQKRQLTALILVPCLVLIFVLFKFVLPASPNKKAVSVSKIQAVVNEVLASTKINWQIPQPYTALPRDPMRPSGSIQMSGQGQTGSAQQFSSSGEITLTGIVYSEDKPAAIMGSQVMHTGEKIGDVSIVRIEKDSVTLERNGQTKILKVGQSWFPTD